MTTNITSSAFHGRMMNAEDLAAGLVGAGIAGAVDQKIQNHKAEMIKEASDQEASKQKARALHQAQQQENRGIARDQRSPYKAKRNTGPSRQERADFLSDKEDDVFHPDSHETPKAVDHSTDLDLDALYDQHKDPEMELRREFGERYQRESLEQARSEKTRIEFGLPNMLSAQTSGWKETLAADGRELLGLWQGFGDTLSAGSEALESDFTGTISKAISGTTRFLTDQLNVAEYLMTFGQAGDPGALQRNAALSRGVINYFKKLRDAPIGYERGYQMGTGAAMVAPMLVGGELAEIGELSNLSKTATAISNATKSSRIVRKIGFFGRRSWNYGKRGVIEEGASVGNEIGESLVLPEAVEEKIASEPKAGDRVYRAWGDDSPPYGRSWTRTDPKTVEKYRNAAGLPDENTGRFLSEGRLTNVEGVIQRSALPLDGNIGGLNELVVPNPQEQIELEHVLGINPEF